MFTVGDIAMNDVGVIEPGRLYLASVAKDRLKIGDWGWRQMRRSGLRVIYQGKRAYVLGDDVLEFFLQLASRQEGGEQ